MVRSLRRRRPSPSPRRRSPGLRDRITLWLETHWVNPAYGGWVLAGLCLFFFAAASNTMAGWLYVMSGLGLALLGVAAFLVRRGLAGLTIQRLNPAPVSPGQALTFEVVVTNGDRRAKSLFQIIDPLPSGLGEPQIHPVRLIPPGQSHLWRYQQVAQQRGLYRWNQIQLRTEAPLGLCGHRRSLPIKAKAVVYPTLFPLEHCPLIDRSGERQQTEPERSSRSQAAAEGLTRSLRPYRWGDPIRMIHWRTTARFGELRVRELETVQLGREIILAIDSGHPWQSLGLERPRPVPSAASAPGPRLSHPPGQHRETIDSFEQAVTALASLYRYASRRYGQVQVWTASHGLIQGEQRILEALAAVQPGQSSGAIPDRSGKPMAPPSLPLIWLTQTPASLAALSAQSVWLLWPQPLGQASPLPPSPLQGKVIDPSQPLPLQLQGPLQAPVPG